MVSSGHVQTKNCTKIRLQSDPPDGVYSAAAHGGQGVTAPFLRPHPASALTILYPLQRKSW